jgi:hypothetical protein
MAGNIKISTLVVTRKDLLYACSRSKMVTVSAVTQPPSGHLIIQLASGSVRLMHSYSTCLENFTSLTKNKMVKRYLHVKNGDLALLEMNIVH